MHDDPRDLDLEAAIAEDPDDRAALHVYADWLLERRDPRGELIALQCAGASRAAIDAFVERHATYLLGPLARHRAHLTWGIGYLEALDLIASDPRKSTIETLLRHPSARFLRRLSLDGERGLDLLPATLRALALRGIRDADLHPLATIAERLGSLTVDGDWTADRFAFPAVETARFAAFDLETERRITRTSWPRLADLTLVSCDGRAAPSLLDRAPALTTLRLEHVSFVDQLVRLLAASPVAERLTSLAIRGALTDAGASALLEARLPSLTTISVVDTRVSADGIELLRATGLLAEPVHWMPGVRDPWMDG